MFQNKIVNKYCLLVCCNNTEYEQKARKIMSDSDNIIC